MEDFFKKPTQTNQKPSENINSSKSESDAQRLPKKKNFYQRRRKYFKKVKEAEQPKSKIPFKKISIVIPLLNEEESINPLTNEIRKSVKALDTSYEVIFIDDGSNDKSLDLIKEVCRTDRRFKYFSFQKNNGKSAALQLGFQNATGDLVITMDADLQDDPNEIPNLIAKLSEGYDLCSGWKKVRHDPFVKKYSSRFFNFVTKVLSGINIHDFNCGLKAYRKEVVENIKVYGELHRYIPVLAKWQGFTITEIPVKHHPRRYGKTKFGISRFFKGFIDLITVVFLTRYIKRPMHLFGFLGAISFLFGLIVNGYLTFLWFTGVPLSNRPMLFLGMLLIIVGVQFFSVGLLGEMFVHQIRDEKEYVVKDKG